MDKIQKKSIDNHLEKISRNLPKGNEIESVHFEKRYSADPVHFERMASQEIRDNFLIEKLFTPGKIQMLYSFVDRVIVGSVVPVNIPLSLEPDKAMRCEYFCQNRELGLMNIGGFGQVTVDGKKYTLDSYDALYVGKGSKDIIIESKEQNNPAKIYFTSFPAHKTYPTRMAKFNDAEPIELGSTEKANKRTIYKYICPGVIESCQLCMGFTRLEKGSVWNTMPSHTHDRRMEVYMYFDLKCDDAVFHFMGESQKTRHIVVRNGQAVISPSWSIHSGCGTSNYSFIWCMGGENQEFTDMDHVDMNDLL